MPIERSPLRPFRFTVLNGVLAAASPKSEDLQIIFPFASTMRNEGQGRRKIPSTLLDQVPDRPGCDDRDRYQYVKLAFAQDERAQHEKRHGRADEPQRAQTERIYHHEDQQGARLTDLVFIQPGDIDGYRP